jgi:hypothetical protein
MSDPIQIPPTEESARKLLDVIPQFIPGVPNSAWFPILWGQLRGIIAVLDGMGFAWARWVEGEQSQQYISGAILIIILFSSGWNKVRAEIAKYRAAAASAAQSAVATANNTPADVQPVAIAVTPVGTKVMAG